MLNVCGGLLLPNQSRVIADIHSRMIALIESLTNNPELRETARILAQEFSSHKFDAGLGTAPDNVDIEASARLILKRQILILFAERDKFTPAEKERLNELSILIAQL